MIDSIATIPKYINFILEPKQYELLSSDTIGQRIKKLRMNKNLKAKELGDLINVTCSGVINYENNNAYPSRKILFNLINVLGKEVLCDSYSKFIIKDYGNILKSWRKKNNLTIHAAAKVLDVSQTAYIDWEKQNTIISRKMYHKLRAFFNKIES